MKKVIVISAINIFDGGPLSVFRDFLTSIKNTHSENFRIIAFVHKVELFNSDFKQIEFKEIPSSRSSYILRFFFEYIYFYLFSIKHKPKYWFSFHDISPLLFSTVQFVYCHNPSPFYNFVFRDIYTSPKLVLFSIFYKFFYRFNINSNKFIVVQQDWIRQEFVNLFNINEEKIIVANPSCKTVINPNILVKNPTLNFFYPTLPRSFKNIEILCKSVEIILRNFNYNFSIYITIDGTENKYSKNIIKKYGYLENIKFIGKQKRQEVYCLYNYTDCLIFPSKLETWGMPLTEFRQFNKPILVSDLPYAHENIGDYNKVRFFNPYDPEELASLMKDFLDSKLVYDNPKETNYNQPYCKSWEELNNLIFK